MSQPAAPVDRWLIQAMRVLFAAHALSLIALCWQQKLTPDEANYVLAGCILRQDGSFAAYNTVLHGPLALWPNQLGVLFADPADMAAYAPWGRLGFVPFSLLAALALVRLSRQAFGARIAFAALLVWSTNPLVLAHGCLMTADMALTCGSLWTLYATWRWLSAPRLLALLSVGLLLGLTLATKYLGLLLIPALGVALVIALAIGFAPRILFSRARIGLGWRVCDAVLGAAVVAIVATCALHAAYLFAVPGYAVQLPPPGLEIAAEDPTYGPKSAGVRAVAETSIGRVALAWLPEPWVRGADYQKLVSEGLPTFFGDEVAPGFWTYYLVAFGTKLPLIALALLLLGAGVQKPRWPPHLRLITGVGIAVPLVFLSAITTLQVGVRYALPVVPLLCLLAGRGLAWLGCHTSFLARCGSGLATVALLAGTALTWPRFLPAFNSLAPRPYLWFKDSTLDWRADAPANDRDLAALRRRQPEGKLIDGALGPSFGRLLIHGEQLAPRDPRDLGRIHHWLRRFWPIDHVGGWFAFEVNEATFRAALAADRAAAARGEVELAMALLGEGKFEAADVLLRAASDQDRDRIAAAAVDLRSDSGERAAAALLQLGRHDLVVQRGEEVPRTLRAQALLLCGDPGAVVTLLEQPATPLTSTEVYLLASALGALGRPADALALVERTPPSDPAGRAVHDRIVRRLREIVMATARADATRLRR